MKESAFQPTRESKNCGFEDFLSRHQIIDINNLEKLLNLTISHELKDLNFNEQLEFTYLLCILPAILSKLSSDGCNNFLGSRVDYLKEFGREIVSYCNKEFSVLIEHLKEKIVNTRSHLASQYQEIELRDVMQNIESRYKTIANAILNQNICVFFRAGSLEMLTRLFPNTRPSENDKMAHFRENFQTLPDTIFTAAKFLDSLQDEEDKNKYDYLFYSLRDCMNINSPDFDKSRFQDLCQKTREFFSENHDNNTFAQLELEAKYSKLKDLCSCAASIQL